MSDLEKDWVNEQKKTSPYNSKKQFQYTTRTDETGEF